MYIAFYKWASPSSLIHDTADPQLVLYFPVLQPFRGLDGVMVWSSKQWSRNIPTGSAMMGKLSKFIFLSNIAQKKMRGRHDLLLDAQIFGGDTWQLNPLD